MGLRVVIITQEDTFAIPQNLARVMALERVEVLGIYILDVPGAVVNRKWMFVRGFGFSQAARMAMRLGWASVQDRLDRLFGYRVLREKRSVRAVACRRGIPSAKVTSVNNSEFLNGLKMLSPDVVLSFSAPCVFKRELLELPRFGCINLHCSLLPKYAGLLPSFWVLFHKEKVGGATVHFMDDKIDNGAILLQSEIPIEPGITMSQLIELTKKVGGELVCRVLEAMRDGRPIVPKPNRAHEGCYFSWPTVSEMRSFRNSGGRMI